ncbi:MAG: hypothetical protein IJZ51_02405 [Ruminiclostridium sp.]|nr:hypothetical protein [Ruminiclostridium sp.]
MREMQQQMIKNAEIIAQRMKSDPAFMADFNADPKAAIVKIEGIEVPDVMLDLTIARARQQYAMSIVG